LQLGTVQDVATPTNTQFAVAVHVLGYLAAFSRDRLIGSDELAESVNASPVYIRRALGPLREAGMVRSHAGAHGGWEIVSDAEKITLADVWNLVQKDDAVLGLHAADPNCPVGSTVHKLLGQVDRDVAAAIENELANRTIAQLATEAKAKLANN
jgi:Rrf2 family protein